MRVIETKVFKIEEHPNPEKVYAYIRHNWHDLNEFTMYELVSSLKALASEIGATLDYSVSTVPDRGEFIAMKGGDRELLSELDPDELPLTGVFWDAEVIEAAQGFDGKDFSDVLAVLHKETEYRYSDEALYEHCRANQYEFTEDGKFVG